MPEPAPPERLRPPAWARTLEALPPALRHQLAELLTGAAAWPVVARAAEPWLAAEPSLAELGIWLIGARQPVELRQLGCRWLAQFPSADTAARLAQLAVDDAAPAPVREQAIASLAARQLRGHHAALRWPPEAIQIADEALIRLASAATARGVIASERLPHALRHVASDGLTAVFARAPGLWGEALECFASPPLARVLAVSLDDIAPPHRTRVLRLIAATLGEEIIALLLARIPRAPAGEQLEMAQLALAIGGEAHLGTLEELLRGKKLVELVRARARWHLAHRGVVPTVRGLRIARTTATIAAAERAARCAQAADDLGALTQFERHDEAYLYTMWGWMVHGAGDPARARVLVAAHPASQAVVRDLYLEDLARRGRVSELVAAAHDHGGADHAAVQLAIWGRPLAALALAQTAPLQTAALVCARALACYRAGRPDLTAQILADDLPPPAVTGDDPPPRFPGPDEQWRIDHGAGPPTLAALAAGAPAIIALAQPAPHGAEPDAASIEPLSQLARRLARRLPGATVYLAGELAADARGHLVASLEAAGARVVGGPAPGTDYYVAGAGCSAQVIAQLERHGVRRLGALGTDGGAA